MKESLRFRLDQMSDRFEEVTAMLSEPETMNDNKKFRELSVEHSDLSALVDVWGKYRQAEEDLATAEEMLSDSAGDGDMKEMAQEEIQAAKDTINALEDVLNVMMLPKDPNDKVPAFLEIRAGTGGDEAAIFAGDLFRMYERYAESKGWSVQVLSSTSTDMGGYKDIQLAVRTKGTIEDPADGVWAHLKYEAGVHRVQRVPVTESQGRIHTSAAGVLVFAEVDDPGEVEINDNDLRIDVYRSSGPGGQSVNTTDSAVRITHLPTGVVVSMQDEKSQIQNREAAMRVLRARLRQMQLDQQAEENAALRRSQVRTVDRSERIRTYNFPENRISDHRTGYKAYNLDQVLAGNLEPLIDSARTMDEAERLANAEE